MDKEFSLLTIEKKIQRIRELSRSREMRRERSLGGRLQKIVSVTGASHLMIEKALDISRKRVKRLIESHEKGEKPRTSKKPKLLNEEEEKKLEIKIKESIKLSILPSYSQTVKMVSLSLFYNTICLY